MTSQEGDSLHGISIVKFKGFSLELNKECF